MGGTPLLQAERMLSFARRGARKKGKKERVSHSVMSDSSQPRGLSCQAPLSVGILQARRLQWVAGDSPPWVATASSRGFFPTQGLNAGLWHCRQILYRLSPQGSLRKGLSFRLHISWSLHSHSCLLFLIFIPAKFHAAHNSTLWMAQFSGDLVHS